MQYVSIITQSKPERKEVPCDRPGLPGTSINDGNRLRKRTVKTKLHVFMLLTLCTMQSVAGVDPSEFANVVRTTDPLTPEREQQTFVLPPGFEIQLVAAEPDIAKPLNMAFDHRGRLWVTSSKEYPFPAAPNQQGRDTIKILEDTNNDGRADKIITFADGLNIPMGLYPYKDGVICLRTWYYNFTKKIIILFFMLAYCFSNSIFINFSVGSFVTSKQLVT